MSDPEHARITADEAALEKEYNEALAERARSLRGMTNRMVANTWTTDTEVLLPSSGELIGRVALGGPNEILSGARDFYIGTAKHDAGSYQVFSWVAPVACTYYRKSSTHHVLCDDVIGVRVLAHQAGKIADFQDEFMSEHVEHELFPKRQLHVPRAPVPRRIASQDRAPVVPPVLRGEEPQEVAPPVQLTPPRPILAPSKLPAQQPPPAPPTAVPGPDLRAPDLLRRQLAAPKTVAMSAVLATLQSDQYEAITRPAGESMVLQGHPGTGKTIIGAHRAAYLLNADAPPVARPRGHVLVLGPTAEYVEHVGAALRKLIDDPTRYEVKSIPALLEELAGLPQSTMPTESVLWENVSPDLARLIDLAFTRAKGNLYGETPKAEDVYAELVRLLQDPPQDGLEGEWVRYLRELPRTLNELKRRGSSSFRGLMAYIGARTTQIRHPGHVIVDEAQDIHPIEWEVLGRLGNTGGWTILGDLNQRRTDHTFSSWDEVARLLAIEDEDDVAPVQVLERGYRSTAQIIQFANQLLPPRERALYSLQQDGEVPAVQRAPSQGQLHEVALSAALRLLDRVGTGTAAIITVDLQGFTKMMRRRGWRADVGDPSTWRNGPLILKLLAPARARGLEFDGVVVVEPSDFPENLGRQGVLYTALTRANRLLTVVHHRALPRGMKTHR